MEALDLDLYAELRKHEVQAGRVRPAPLRNIRDTGCVESFRNHALERVLLI